MDKIHSDKPKKSLKEQFVEGMIFLAIIVGVIAFFITAAVTGFDPGLFFQKLFGFITIGAILIAVVAFVAAVVIRLFKLLFGQ